MFHPALHQLLRSQTAAKLRRLRRGFSTKRRLVLSVMAVILTIVWFSNMVLSILFREPATPERFARIVPMGLLLYALWHVIKTAFQRPADAIDWTPAERELLCAGPFARHEIIFYRLASIFNATLVKAACFTLLMLPDLQQPVAGFVGILLSLIVLDLVRVNVEITTHGLAERTYRQFRLAMIALAAVVVASSLIIACSTPPTWNAQSAYVTWAIMRHVFMAAAQLLDTLPGRLVLAPFQIFSQLITTHALTLGWFGRLAVCGLIVFGLTRLMLHLDQWFEERTVRRHQAQYSPRHGERSARVARGANHRGRRIAWLGGAGPIAWRQLRGASRQRNQLAVALALPGALAILPTWVSNDDRLVMLQVSASVAFYSFLLLPTAVKFDFRRDIQRIAVLKTLPIRPTALVVGQIITPTLLACAFQATVLTITVLARPIPIWMLISTLMLLAPLNALIFAFDNLLYLLYPYRLNQEGIEIFLRTTLTFTAKGLIFAVGVALTLVWSSAARQIALLLPVGFQQPAVIFVVGGSLLLFAATAMAVRSLAFVYERFDPSQDTPA